MSDIAGETGLQLQTSRGARWLTREQCRAVIDEFDAVAREATKWRLMMGQAGTVTVIDPTLVTAIEAFLDQ